MKKLTQKLCIRHLLGNYVVQVRCTNIFFEWFWAHGHSPSFVLTKMKEMAEKVARRYYSTGSTDSKKNEDKNETDNELVKNIEDKLESFNFLLE